MSRGTAQYHQFYAQIHKGIQVSMSPSTKNNNSRQDPTKLQAILPCLYNISSQFHGVTSLYQLIRQCIRLIVWMSGRTSRLPQTSSQAYDVQVFASPAPAA